MYYAIQCAFQATMYFDEDQQKFSVDYGQKSIRFSSVDEALDVAWLYLDSSVYKIVKIS